MLVKLIKYDIKSLSRKLLPFYGILIIFSILNKFLFKNNLELSISPILDASQLIVIVIYSITISVVLFGTTFVAMYRFYNNMFKDEGYLTNTLPVEKWKILLSKILSGLVLTFISMIVCLISLFIANGVGDLPFDLLGTLKMQDWGNIITIFIALLIQLSENLVKLFAVVSIGQLFKHKILMSVVTYIGLEIITNILEGILIKGRDINNLIFINSLGTTDTIVINIIYFIIFFFTTNYIIKNKLNLE